MNAKNFGSTLAIRTSQLSNPNYESELPKPTHKGRQLWADQHEKKTPYNHIDGLVCYK